MASATKSGAEAPYPPGFGLTELMANDGLFSMSPRDSPSAEDNDNSTSRALPSEC